MQKLRQAQGAFAKDSGAFQRAREVGRLQSPQAYSPQAGVDPMAEITLAENGTQIPHPRAYTPRTYLEDASARRIDGEHLSSPEVAAMVRAVSPRTTFKEDDAEISIGYTKLETAL